LIARIGTFPLADFRPDVQAVESLRQVEALLAEHGVTAELSAERIVYDLGGLSPSIISALTISVGSTAVLVALIKGGTAILIEWMKRTRIKKVVFKIKDGITLEATGEQDFDAMLRVAEQLIEKQKSAGVKRKSPAIPKTPSKRISAKKAGQPLNSSHSGN
jgi:hypothetical protein